MSHYSHATFETAQWLTNYEYPREAAAEIQKGLVPSAISIHRVHYKSLQPCCINPEPERRSEITNAASKRDESLKTEEEEELVAICVACGLLSNGLP